MLLDGEAIDGAAKDSLAIGQLMVDQVWAEGTDPTGGGIYYERNSQHHRRLQAFTVQPHRQKHFNLSTDPFLVEKVRDIVGLYLNPSDKGMVLCVDEKMQIQPWTGRSRCCPWAWATWRGSRTTTSAMAPPPCSLPWTLPRGRC